MKKILLTLIIFSCVSVLAQEYWQLRPQLTFSKLHKIQFVDTLYGWMAGDSGVILHTTNGGNNWVRQNSQITNYTIDDIFFINRDLGWGVANDFYFFGTKILKTTNGGLNWQLSVYPDTTIVFNTIHFLNIQTGFLSGYSGYVYKTTNGGTNWFQCRVDTSFCQLLYLFPKNHFNFLNSNTGFVCGGQIDIQGIIWKTNDAGLNWLTYCITPEPLYRVKAAYPHKIIATGGDPEYGSSIAFSRDSGNTWIWDAVGPSIDSAFYGIGRALAYRTPAELWVPLSIGPIWGVSLDSGDSEGEWQKIPTPEGRTIYDAIFVTPTFGWACGDTGAMLKYNSAIIGLSEQHGLFPLSFKLHQNYPNPFNPVTLLKFDLPKENMVKLIIYDVLGREVDVLVNDLLKPGNYELIWDAAIYPSGIYFYKLQAGDWTESKKMVLLK